MMTEIGKSAVIGSLLMLRSGFVRAVDEIDSATRGPVKYEPTVESLRQAEVPEWFIDGKLGILMHRGTQSITGAASTCHAR